MLVPHSKSNLLKIKLPVVALAASVVLWLVGTAYVISMGVNTLEYYGMRKKLSYFTEQLTDLRSTIVSLQKAEGEFRRLFSLKSKTLVIEQAADTDAGALDMELLKKQVREAMETVSEIKHYIREQRDVYFATPAGWPVEGAVSSPFGNREHPKSGQVAFHSGVDIRVPHGTQVKATADGIASYAGWTPGSGNTVVLEHGQGFSTVYAHNTQNLVKLGQRLKRGDTIARSGATGITTGPHVHYEIWKDGRHVNPITFLKERS
jgi:murein DD-endopeptidase MepM/ murein hydrolase activator NlpD